jgi:hypothetical protein
MRSDYGLYIVAVICFIIAGIFLTGAIPDYALTGSMGMVAIPIFVILGVIFAVTGYATKPKIATLPAKEPQPALAEPTPLPVAPVVEEVTAEPVTEPAPTEAPPQETPTAIEEPVPPPPPPLASVEETAKTEEEKPPVEKPVRRRRRKKTE